MTHYAHVLVANRLQLAVHLGFYTGERAKPQPVEVSFRLYFPQAPAQANDDEGSFIDYGMLCKAVQEFVAAREFKLVEFMGMEIFRYLRGVVDGHGGESIRLWVKLNKIAAPVPGLTGGASFVHSDLPAGATWVAAGE